MKHLTLLLSFIVILPLIAVFDAWIMSEIWGRTAAIQYGAGPTMLSWWGIALLITAMTLHLAPKSEPSKTPVEDLFRSVAGKVLGRLLLIVIVMFVVRVVGW